MRHPSKPIPIEYRFRPSGGITPAFIERAHELLDNDGTSWQPYSFRFESTDVVGVFERAAPPRERFAELLTQADGEAPTLGRQRERAELVKQAVDLQSRIDAAQRVSATLPEATAEANAEAQRCQTELAAVRERLAAAPA